MNRKTNQSNLLASVAAGALLTISSSTALFAQGGPMEGHSNHNRMTMTQHDMQMSRGHSGPVAGSELVGFGEYDPASPQRSHAAQSALVPRSEADVANIDVGFGETDPAGTASADIDAAPHHDMSMVADGATQMNRDNGMNGACMTEREDRRKC